MTPELLALLSTEQREAWERCQKATAGPWHDAGNFVRDKYDHDLMAAYQRMCWKRDGEVWTEEESAQGYKNRSVLDVRNNAAFAAHARQDLPAALLELAQAKQALAELQAAVADAPHDMWCAVTFPAAPADLMACNCWKSETK